MANVANGAVYQMPPGINLELGEMVFPKMLEVEQVEPRARALRAELQAALERDERIVGVSDDVAHQLQVGQRELARRQRRRRARRS